MRLLLGVLPRKVFEESNETNEKGVKLPRIARPEDCTLCGLCVRLCPDFALTIVEEEAEGGYGCAHGQLLRPRRLGVRRGGVVGGLQILRGLPHHPGDGDS